MCTSDLGPPLCLELAAVFNDLIMLQELHTHRVLLSELYMRVHVPSGLHRTCSLLMLLVVTSSLEGSLQLSST